MILLKVFAIYIYIYIHIFTEDRINADDFIVKAHDHKDGRI